MFISQCILVLHCFSTFLTHLKPGQLMGLVCVFLKCGICIKLSSQTRCVINTLLLYFVKRFCEFNLFHTHFFRELNLGITLDRYNFGIYLFSCRFLTVSPLSKLVTDGNKVTNNSVLSKRNGQKFHLLWFSKVSGNYL